MRISHLALWVKDLEKMREFYLHHFVCESGLKYENIEKGFSSYFLRWKDSECALELMHKNGLSSLKDEKHGLAHFAISLGSEESVRIKTESLRALGVVVKSPPRWTGDGYYESVVEDPEGNLIELTV